ncbi:MAG: nitrilase-related carbon-nitrogen hydrolase [Trueperaceae bacterium]|nr:nitrilase-related carbon-nitrogen hydrolase [Trueperaceae bacterium]
MRLLLAASTATMALGTAHEALAILVVPALALALHAARRARSYLGACAASALPVASALAVTAGGAVQVWPWAPLAALPVAAPFALAGAVHARALRGGASMQAASLGFAAAWLSVEAAWGHLGGLPLVRVGYLVAATPLGPTAALAGVSTTSVAAWLAALAVADLPLATRRPRAATLRRPAMWLGCLTALLLATHLAVPPRTLRASPGDATTRVALLQTGVRRADRAWAARWPEAGRALRARLDGQLRRAVRQGARLIIGPEGTLSPTGVAGPRVAPVFGTAPFAVLVGAAVRDDAGLRNAVVDLADDAAVRYVKRHPVPWHEDRFEAGTEAAQVTFGPRRLSLAVCFDLVYAAEIRAATRDADALVAVSDAAFAGRSAMPHLQLAVARLRAAENGTPVLFVTATGPTTVLDARGRTVAHTSGRDPAVLVHDLAWARARTPYARFGGTLDLPALALAAGATRRRGVRPLTPRRRRP